MTKLKAEKDKEVEARDEIIAEFKKKSKLMQARAPCGASTAPRQRRALDTLALSGPHTSCAPAGPPRQQGAHGRGAGEPEGRD